MFSKLLFKTSSKITFLSILGLISITILMILFLLYEKENEGHIKEIIKYSHEITDIHNARISAQRLVMPANDYLITGNRQEIKRYKKIYPEVKRDLKKLHDFVAKLPESDPYKKKEQKILDDASKALEKLNKLANIILSNPPDDPKSGDLMEEMDAHADFINSELAKYHQIDLMEINEMFLESKQSITYAIQIAMYYVIASFIVVIALGFWMHGSISHPISKLHAATLNVIEGEYPHIEALQVSDIGALGETFNVMSDQIQSNTSILQKTNAELSKAKNISETRAQSLSMISNITSAACATLDIDEILQSLLKNIKYFFNADCAAYFKFEEITNSLLFELCIGDHEKGSISFKINKDKNIITDAFLSKKSLFKNYPTDEFTGEFKKYFTSENFQCILVSPLLSAGKTIGVLTAVSKSVDHFNGSDAELLQTLSNYAASAISNAHLHNKIIETEKFRQKQEFKIAKNMLTKLLPQKSPEINSLSVDFISKPAKIIGGDFYDFIKLDNNQMIFSIGDVVGKSISAALLISMNKYILKTDAYHTRNILQPVNTLNTVMVEETTPEVYTTLIFSKIDTDKKTLSYINCGHPPFIHYKKNESKCYYNQLDESQYPIGIRKDYPFKIKDINYERGDTFVFFTDGITEAKDKNRNLYGYERLLDLVENNINLDSHNLVKFIENDVLKYCDNDQEDDIVIIVMKC